MSLGPPLLWFLLVSASVLGLALVPVPGGSLLWNALLESGHVPMFGAFALAARAVCLRGDPTTIPARRRRYLLALGITTAASVLTELAQLPAARDVEASDLARNLAGGVAALLIAYSLDRKAHRAPRSRIARISGILLAVTLLGLGFWEVLTLAVHTRQREAAFPTLCSFAEPWGLSLVNARGVDIRRVEAPPEWGIPGRVARLTYHPQDYPSLLLREPAEDWRGYDRLEFTLFSPLDQPIRMLLRIDDAEHDHTFGDRFNRALEILPGLNRVEVALDDVRRAPAARELDLGRISGLALFAADPPRPFTVYLDAFRLARN